jgi:hypothetical protein
MTICDGLRKIGACVYKGPVYWGVNGNRSFQADFGTSQQTHVGMERMEHLQSSGSVWIAGNWT